MSRDYARTKDTRKKSSRYGSRRASANFTWLIVGVIFGLVIAGLGYLKQRVTVSVHPHNSLQAEGGTTKKSSLERHTKLKPEETSEDKVHFDFYTILPGAKVSTPAQAEKPVLKAEPLPPSRDKTIATPPTPLKSLQDAEQGLLSPAKSVMAVKSSNLKVVEPAKNSLSEQAAIVKKPLTKALPKKDNAEKASITAHKLTKPIEKPAKKVAKSVVPVVDLTASKPLPVKPAAISNSIYIVQIAAFKRYEDADQLKAQLILVGYDAKIKIIPLKGVNWHRVWLGPFPTAQSAEKIQKELLIKHTTGVVVKVR